jgi:hypothetical protein
MTAIAILPDHSENGIIYRAIAGAKYSEGKTVGEALDALSKQLSEEESAMLVIVQTLKPDRFFTAEQQQRLSELMALWREARDKGNELRPEEQAELKQLIDAELQSATLRSEFALSELKS